MDLFKTFAQTLLQSSQTARVFVHAGKFPGFFFYRPGTGPYLAPSGQCSLELYTRVELTQTQHGFAWKSCNYRKQKDLHVGALPSKAMLRCLVSD